MAKNSRVREHFAFLTYLQTISPRRQKVFIKVADRPILEALSEIAINLIKRNVKLSPSEIDKLRPFEEQIYQLSLKKHSINKKKRIVQQRGGFLTALLGAVLPALISTVINATQS